MNVQQFSLSQNNWEHQLSALNIEVNIFLLFVSPDFYDKENLLNNLHNEYPKATIIGCSTAGEISGITVKDKSVSLVAIQLEKTPYKKASAQIKDMSCSYKAGQELASKLYSKDLNHVFVLSDGLNVNGEDLVSGLKSKLPEIYITGGLAADGTNFKETFVINDNEILNKTIIGLGFYGDHLKIGFSSKGGWNSFGIERLVTKSKQNVLYELDGMPALEIYKSFLGEAAKDLPSSGLLFPLSMRVDGNSLPIVRTVLAVNEEAQSITFAGNVSEGSYVRLMKASIDRLINGAQNSAVSANKVQQESIELAILISYVGRRLVLKQMVEEEVEVVREIIGDKPSIAGFYSYGEIAPFEESLPCELHNQTITIITLSEC